MASHRAPVLRQERSGFQPHHGLDSSAARKALSVGDVSECTCVPGDPSEGWIERRCQVCLDEERSHWREMIMRHAHEIVQRDRAAQRAKETGS